MHKPCPTCGDDGDKWAGQSGGLIVGDEGKPTVQCQACGTHATETTWNAPRAYERQIASLEAEVLALRKDAERWRWLREQNANLDAGFYVGNETDKLPKDITWVGSDLDAAIDAAIEAERGEG